MTKRPCLNSWHTSCNLIKIKMLNSFSNLVNQEEDNLCKVLQCDREELSRLFKHEKNCIVKNTVFMKYI